MRDIKLIDSCGTKKIRLCEKHWAAQLHHLMSAQAGGTSFAAVKTSNRGCHFCTRNRNKAG